MLSFFEHNMRFLCYSAALCIQINRFQSEGHVKNVSTFEFLSILNKKNYFLVSVRHNHYTIGLNYQY